MQFLCLCTILYILQQVCFPTLASCLTPANIQELLASHNNYRRQMVLNYTISNMNQLVWSESLAALAATYIDCRVTRSARRGRLASRISQGFNVGTRRAVEGALTQIVSRWHEEISHFLPDESECFPYNACSNVRNVLNAKHSHIGCAAVDSCGGRQHRVVLLCIYDGGIKEEFGFKYAPICTGCTSPMSFCKSNLCVSCNSNEPQCECPKTCQKPGVGLGHLDPSSCTCTCTYGNGPNCDETCEGPEQYLDFDICALVQRQDCSDPEMGETYREFCPHRCGCTSYPNSTSLSPQFM